jgi:ribosome biogenesis protein BRX1
VLFFEARKREDLYMWMAKSPNGPCAKFLVQNVHTMDELKLTGNHLKNSRYVYRCNRFVMQQILDFSSAL